MFLFRVPPPLESKRARPNIKETNRNNFYTEPIVKFHNYTEIFQNHNDEGSNVLILWMDEDDDRPKHLGNFLLHPNELTEKVNGQRGLDIFVFVSLMHILVGNREVATY